MCYWRILPYASIEGSSNVLQHVVVLDLDVDPILFKYEFWFEQLRSSCLSLGSNMTSNTHFGITKGAWILM